MQSQTIVNSFQQTIVNTQNNSLNKSQKEMSTVDDVKQLSKNIKTKLQNQIEMN